MQLDKIRGSPLDCFQILLGDKENCFLMSMSVEFSGRLDFERLKTALKKMHENIPMLNYFYEGDEFGGFFVREKNSGIFFRESFESPDKIRSEMYPCTEKLFRVILSHGEHSDTLVFLVPHLLTDARGMIQLCSLLGKYYQKNFADEIFPAADRSLGPAFENFSDDKLAELFLREKKRVPEIYSERNFFAAPEKICDEKFLQKKISAKIFLRMKLFAKKHCVSVHDLLAAAYGHALRSYVKETFGVELSAMPLCSTSDLRKYFPLEKRGAIMNYSVAYWSPVVFGENFLATLKNFSDMSREMKQHSLGIGAAANFYGEKLSLDEARDGFFGVPFLSNVGVVSCDEIFFGEDAFVSGVWISSRVPCGDPFSLVVLTYRGEVYCTIFGEDVSGRIMDEMIGILERL